MIAAVYGALKWIHVLLAIAALGANMTYGIWIRRSARHPEHLAFVLRTVKFLDDRLATPAYVLLLLTGVLMIGLGPGPHMPPWLLVSIVLYVVAMALSVGMYRPALRRQIAAAETSGATSPEYGVAAAQGRQLAIIVAAIVVVIAFLMVNKPNFGLAA